MAGAVAAGWAEGFKGSLEGRMETERSAFATTCEGCGKKVQYATKHKAKVAAKRLRCQGYAVVVYACRLCSGWRVGHNTGATKREEYRRGKSGVLKNIRKPAVTGGEQSVRKSSRRRMAVAVLRDEESMGEL